MPSALCIKMNVITELEAHFGVPFPRGYSDWSLKKYTDHREAKSRSRLSSCSMDRYLWVHEAEWILPDEIPRYDLGRPKIIPGLIPFAFSGAGDHWCWNTQAKNGDAEYEILNCWHDEKLADRFAPTFPAWFYRNCLDYASGAFEKTDADIEEARKNLRLWSERLSEIHPGAWADHLAELARTQPSEYKDPKLRADITLFGFITGMKIDEIVADQFGPGYLGQKVEWGTWGE
jgi:hypothetical protein